MITLTTLERLIAQGESATLKLVRSTRRAEARRRDAPRLNGEGSKVLIGVGPDGRPVGHEFADITVRDIAAMLGRSKPTARVEMSRVDVDNGR